MIKAIIFDVGGVLVQKVFAPIVDWLAAEYHIDSSALHGYAWPLFGKVNLGQMTEKQMFEKIVKELHIPIDATLLEQKSMQLKLIPEVWECVKALKGKYKLAILSNMGHAWAKAREEEFHLSGLFDEIVWSCDLGLKKPDLKIFRYLIDKLNVSSEECIFIDDKPSNIDAAKESGMNGIIYQTPQQLRQELATLGVDVSSGK